MSTLLSSRGPATSGMRVPADPGVADRSRVVAMAASDSATVLAGTSWGRIVGTYEGVTNSLIAKARSTSPLSIPTRVPADEDDLVCGVIFAPVGPTPGDERQPPGMS
jgi:hypothetical protein